MMCYYLNVQFQGQRVKPQEELIFANMMCIEGIR